MHLSKRFLTLLLAVLTAAGLFARPVPANADGAQSFHSWDLDAYAENLLGPGKRTVWLGSWYCNVRLESGLFIMADLDESRANVTALNYDAEGVEPDARAAFDRILMPMLNDATDNATPDIFEALANGESVDAEWEDENWAFSTDGTILNLEALSRNGVLFPLEDLLGAAEAGDAIVYKEIRRSVDVAPSGLKGSSHPVALTVGEDGSVVEVTLKAVNMDADAGLAFFLGAVNAMFSGSAAEEAAAFVQGSFADVEFRKPASADTGACRLRISANSKGLKSLSVSRYTVPDGAAVIGEAFRGAAPAPAPTPAPTPVPAPVPVAEDGGAEIFSGEGVTIRLDGGTARGGRSGGVVIPATVRNDTDAELIVSNSYGRPGKINGFPFVITYDQLVPAHGTAALELALPKDEDLQACGLADPDRIETIEFPVFLYTDGPKRIGDAVITHRDLFGTDAPAAAEEPAFGQALEPRVLGEFKGIRLLLNGITPDGRSLDVTLENGNEEERRSVVLRDFAVNGRHLDTVFDLGAGAGDSARGLIRLGDSIPGFAGFSEIRFTFRFCRQPYPGERYYDPVDKKETAVVLTPENAVEPVFPEDPGTLIFDQKDTRLYYQGYEISREGSLYLKVLFVNDGPKDAYMADVYTKKKVYVSFNGEKKEFTGIINGVRADAGMRREIRLGFLPYDLGKAGVSPDKIKTIDFEATLYVGGKKALKKPVAVHIDLG